MRDDAQEIRCAWCGHGAKRPTSVASHGLCERCRTRLCAEVRSLLTPLAGSSPPEATIDDEEGSVSEPITKLEDGS
jgi:hypothetical protein